MRKVFFTIQNIILYYEILIAITLQTPPSLDAMTPPPRAPRDTLLRPVTAAALPTRRSMRWALVTPLLAVVALAILMAVTIWYLTENEEIQRAQTLARDVEATQRSIRDQLKALEEQTAALGRTFAERPSAAELRRLAPSLFGKFDPVIFLAWVDRAGVVQTVQTNQGIPRQVFDAPGTRLSRGDSRAAFEQAQSNKRFAYSSPIRGRENEVEVDLHTVLIQKETGLGTLVASVSLPSLLVSAISNETGNRAAFSLLTTKGDVIVQTRLPEAAERLPFYEVALEPMPQSVKLRGYAIKPSNSLQNNVISTLIGGLIVLAVVGQIVIWRNTRDRLVVERELADETAFRRAMENSMSTGMRVIDQAGTITYVNPAFCRMVGFSVEELTGCRPPFPYWPPETQAQLKRNLERMLSGESPPSGMPINIMRKDGTRLVVRMYTSPLIDQHGTQTGWMTSVTDISEQTRIRQELAQAQERFITVLQALDAAVSVATPAPEHELLFANQAYKKWFGSSLEDGHRTLSRSVRGPWSDVRDVYSERVGRWFEVRIQTIQWVDGRSVELMVATDITQERATEQAQHIQRQRLQQTSRLVTMGEMASSLAHELNQPLTAIANYTSGAVSRLRAAQTRGEHVATDDLMDMLSKTSHQAERAGQVIRRIRSFVKRSDPIRKTVSADTILAETLGLAEIEARERGQTITHQLQPNLPLLNIDPILIEQVLLNLIKNGLDAMADRSRKALHVEVHLSDGQIVFSVRDHGPGVPPAIQAQLFDSFYTTKADGMGMGLNICRSIIESHQGRLWFENHPEGGCTFRFTLPVGSPNSGPAPTPTSETQRT